ncbi:MAG: hypothetical protein NT175_00280 [Bacteroidetes bacterium]|nr:hypothetical protein [Bacteroidota bacterium]
MATKKIELDDDFLGGQGTLTIEEEKALSDFFRKRKMANKPSHLTNATTIFLLSISYYSTGIAGHTLDETAVF